MSPRRRDQGSAVGISAAALCALAVLSHAAAVAGNSTKVTSAAVDLKHDRSRSVLISVGRDNGVTSDDDFAIRLTDNTYVYLYPVSILKRTFWSQSLRDKEYSAVRVGDNVAVVDNLAWKIHAGIRGQVGELTSAFESERKGSRERHGREDGPKHNAMSCAKPKTSNKANGEVACYGLWDYGNAFGDDQAMCKNKGGGSYSPATQCEITTPACRSRRAYASRLIEIQRASDSDIEEIAGNLDSWPNEVRKQLIYVWIYLCAD